MRSINDSNDPMISHRKYMEMAMQLAEKGRGTTSPNPLVGAVVVKRGKIVGRGYHNKAGSEHAEVRALEEAGQKAVNGILYVTLEPCSHWGRTPPCTDLILQSKVREVIIGMKDPHGVVRGNQILKSQSVKTKIGILEEQLKKQNEVYLKYISKKMPFVLLKAGMTLDGKIATKNGKSKYITGKESLHYVHTLRSNYDAVMVGINTVLSDDPRLTTRLANGKNPLKIIVDSRLRVPLKAKVLRNVDSVIIATTHKSPKNKIKKLEKKGISLIITKTQQGKVDLVQLMKALAEQGVCSVMIEGGSELHAAALQAKIVDKILFFVAPAIMGEGIGAIGDLGITTLDKRIRLKNLMTKRLGKDIMIEAYL